VPVRIFFRGLVLFRFPTDGDDANKLVAELISEPVDRTHPQGVPPGQDDHEAEIQIVTGANVQQLLPQGLTREARVDITIPDPPAGTVPTFDRVIRRAPSFDAHVPKISRLARQTPEPLRPGQPDNRYVRNTITVNRGVIRVKDVVIWDEGGFRLTPTPPPGNILPADIGLVPATAAQVKFMAVEVRGHAANECVVEVPETDIVVLESQAHPQLSKKYQSVRKRNQRAQNNTIDILFRNYEYQREKPVPWGMDFQFFFARLGYGTVDLDAAGELTTFDTNGRRYDPRLLADDRRSLLPVNDGHPFPYIISENSLGKLVPLHPPVPSTSTDIDSRPVCVPGDE